MAGGRRNRGQYGGRIVSGARMWLEVEEKGDCMAEAVCKEQGCGWRKGRQYGGRNVSGARMWLDARETGDCMMDATCQEPGYGWR